MKPYSVDFREKVVSAIEKGDSSFRKVAQRFAISKSCVERWVAQKRTQGHVVPHKQGGSVSPSMAYADQLAAILAKRADVTLAEACELLFDATGPWGSPSTMCRTLPRLNLPRKKDMPLQSNPSLCLVRYCVSSVLRSARRCSG